MRVMTWHGLILMLVVGALFCRQHNANNTEVRQETGEKLYDCLLTNFPQTQSALSVSMYHLLLNGESVENVKSSNKKIASKSSYIKSSYDSKLITVNDINFEVLDPNSTVEQLKTSYLDPNLPFTFFVNGFNNQTEGAFEATWMYDLATVFVRYYMDEGHESATNVIFIPWQIAGLFGMDPFSVGLVYYRTMANYEIVLNRIETALTSLVDFVEATRDRTSDAYGSPGSFYSRFTLYGHSLGAHIIADAANRVNRARPFVKFGLIVGLDPAVICFQGDYGISAVRTSNSASRVVVVHTNAGLTSVSSERGHVEVFINGGSFQPDCSWHDLLCHHSRSHDILRYSDDECMMVAYRCNKYEQFKLGACQLCDDPSNIESPSVDTPDPNCILANLVEQHSAKNDDNDSLFLGRRHNTRRLTDSDVITTGSRTKVQRVSRRRFAQYAAGSMDKKRLQYHFVNTNPDYMANNRSHCFQHYQLRLLTMNDEAIWRRYCPLNSYGTGQIQTNLFEQLQTDYIFDSHLNESYAKLLDRLGSHSKTLATVVPDTLHTGLLNFAGKPRLFTSASIEGIDLGAWSRCMVKNKYSSKLEFVLDIAFMSDTRSRMRDAHSSILCGQWSPHDDSRNNPLILNLCKQSELANVSCQIDDILRDIRFNHEHDSWQVSLLNSLFSLFLEWDPFIKW